MTEEFDVCEQHPDREFSGAENFEYMLAVDIAEPFVPYVVAIGDRGTSVELNRLGQGVHVTRCASCTLSHFGSMRTEKRLAQILQDAEQLAHDLSILKQRSEQQ